MQLIMISEIEKEILNYEIDGYQKQKLELVKKRQQLEQQRIVNSDPAKEHSINSEIEKTSNIISDIDTKLGILKESLTQSVQDNEVATIVNKFEQEKTSNNTSSDDVLLAIKVLKQEGRELGYNSSKEDFAKIHDLKVKIFNEIFNEVDEQLNFVVGKRELMYSSSLFDRIYMSEVLDTITINEIQKIREDTLNFKWYDRSVIVSALSLSLISFKFDSKKANLLLDFVTDFEANHVWERALTGLVIAIIYQKNRSWLRAKSFLDRLQTLKNNDEIQEGLKKIDFILKNELYKANLQSPEIFKLDLFKEPLSCFVPFYEDNQILREALDNAPIDFDVKHFNEYLELPLLNSHKYALCIGLSERGLETKTLSKKESNIVGQILFLNDEFNPFQALISEFYCFFQYFPVKKVDDVFVKQLLLSKTDLKTYILNQKMSLLLDANTLYREDKFDEAIKKYKNLLELEDSLDIHWQLANCYFETDNYKLSLKHYNYIKNKLEIDKNASKQLNFKIAICEHELDNFNQSNQICQEILDKVENPSLNLLCLMADNFAGLNDIEKGIKLCEQAEIKIEDDYDMFRISQTYYGLEQYDKSLVYINKSIEINSEKGIYWKKLLSIYCETLEWELAFALLSNRKIDKKFSDPITVSRINLFSLRDIEAAFHSLNSLLVKNVSYKGIVYGNLGHYYIIKKDLSNAYEKYWECIKLLKDENEFENRMKRDEKFMIKLGKEKEYNETKEKVINDFVNSKK